MVRPRANRAWPFVRPCVVVALGAALCGAGGGCAALPLATLGILAEFTASAVSTGKDVYRLGKLDTAEMARDDQVIAATLLAAQELHLTPKK